MYKPKTGVYVTYLLVEVLTVLFFDIFQIKVANVPGNFQRV